MAIEPKFPPAWNPAQWATGAMPGADEFRKLLDGLKLPAAPDAEALMRAHQRNIEALSAANRIALEGAQAVAKRHMEIMQQTMSELTETLKAMAASDTPQEKAAKQAELLKAAYERAVATTREIGDLIQRASGEALAALNQRVSEAIDEMKALLQPGEGGKKK
jgi:phasin family protein